MTKGTNKVEVYFNNELIGRLALTPEGLCAFEYDAAFLKNGFSVSPFYLPLRSGVFIAKRDPFHGLFGVFNDSLPDGWGTLLTDRVLMKNKIPLSEVSVLDRLCLVGADGIGALSYKPKWKIVEENDDYDLNKLAREIDLIMQNDFSGHIEDLFIKGGSSGGARPKVLLKIDSKDWLVKFKSSSDPLNIGEIEYQYSLTAKKCGINMPETRLFEGKYFGSQRFDIEGNQRYHLHSASGLLYASYRYPSLDYTELMKATTALTHSIEEALKLFRVMVFNVLNKNRDDHAKNFSFIYKDGSWKLSPAYDLVLSVGFNGQHTTTINGNGNPSTEDLFEVAKNTGLPLKKAKLIYEEVFENSKELKKYID